MRRILASTILVAAVFAQSVSSAAAQDVRNTSYVTKSGERVLRIETVVPATTESVWKAWTDPQELSKWIAPVVAIDLKIGGKDFYELRSKGNNRKPRYHSVADHQLRRGTAYYTQGELNR